MGTIVWTGNIVEHRPYHVKASGVWMGAYPTRRRAIRHARRLLRDGWASVIIEDVRVTASAEKGDS